MALRCMVSAALALAATAASAQTGTAPVPARAPVANPVLRIPGMSKGALLAVPPTGAQRPPIAPRRFVARKKGVFGGRRMAYSVISEDIVLADPLGDPTGSIFSFSYIAHAPAGARNRPVMFIFNGGPGSSSVWLHMGLLGPRKVAYRDVTTSQVPPFDTVDNPDSALAVADLVFIDPVGTGFSRWWGKGRPADFYGSEEDAAATVQFIERWLRRHHRWGSPKFLLGESYGTTRAALVARRLMGGFLDGTLHGIALNGVVLVGGDGGLAKPAGNDSFLTGFTTQAATAWYHGRADRGGRDFDTFIADADRFARTELIPALDRGATLDAATLATLARRHAGFTGLDPALVAEKRLRVSQADFARALLADRGEIVGTYDTRYTLPAANSLGDPVGDDPAMGQYSAVFTGGLNRHIREELGVDIDEDYVLIDWVNVNTRWNWNRDESDPGADLAAAMRRNPDLWLMSTQGWFDLFGAVGTARYGIAQRGLPTQRVIDRAYVSGHMPYVGEAGVRMAADVKDFIGRAVRGRPTGETVR